MEEYKALGRVRGHVAAKDAPQAIRQAQQLLEHIATLPHTTTPYHHHHSHLASTTTTTQQPRASRKVAPSPHDPFGPHGPPPRASVDWPLHWRLTSSLADALDQLPHADDSDASAADALFAAHCDRLVDQLRAHMEQLSRRAIEGDLRGGASSHIDAPGGVAVLASCATIVSSLRLHAFGPLFRRMEALDDALALELALLSERAAEHLERLCARAWPHEASKPPAVLALVRPRAWPHEASKPPAVLAGDTRALLRILNSAGALVALVRDVAMGRPTARPSRAEWSETASASLERGRTALERARRLSLTALCEAHTLVCISCALAGGEDPPRGSSTHASYGVHLVLFGVHATALEVRGPPTRGAEGAWPTCGRLVVLGTLRRTVERLATAMWAAPPRDESRLRVDLVLLLALSLSYCPSLAERCGASALDGRSEDGLDEVAETSHLMTGCLWLLVLLALCDAPAESVFPLASVASGASPPDLRLRQTSSLVQPNAAAGDAMRALADAIPLAGALSPLDDHTSIVDAATRAAEHPPLKWEAIVRSTLPGLGERPERAAILRHWLETRTRLA